MPVLLGIAGCAAAVALFLFRASPRASVVLWVLVLFFVPVWVGVVLGFFWALLTLLTAVAIAANVADVRLTAADGIVAAFAALVIGLFATGAATLSATVIALLEWLLPYVWGRLVLARVSPLFVTRAVAVAATTAAVLALIEFASGVNPFTAIPGVGNAAEWAELQSRAGFLRAEGAFGHSIALGAVLAMSSAFIVASRWRAPIMLLSLAAVGGAVVVTFSRIGLASLALTVALAVVLLPGVPRAVRWSIVMVGAAALVVVVPFLEAVFTDAGSEAAGSAAYRGGLLAVVPQVEMLGSTGDWEGLSVDGVYLGAFSGSVDNTLLLIALRFGWIPTALVAALLATVVLGLLRHRANPAAIAVAAQVPSLFAVALITQFGMLLWFFLGLAVAWRTLRDDGGVAARAPTAASPRERAGAR
jgi:hypothetical protein